MFSYQRAKYPLLLSSIIDGKNVYYYLLYLFFFLEQSFYVIFVYYSHECILIKTFILQSNYLLHDIIRRSMPHYSKLQSLLHLYQKFGSLKLNKRCKVFYIILFVVLLLEMYIILQSLLLLERSQYNTFYISLFKRSAPFYFLNVVIFIFQFVDILQKTTQAI